MNVAGRTEPASNEAVSIATPRRCLGNAGGEPPCSCQRLRAGVRFRCARFEQWTQASNARAVAPPGRYAALLQQVVKDGSAVTAQTARQITMDVERTCPVLSFFQGGGGKEMLTNILSAWVVLDAEASDSSEHPIQPVGYVQGMSFIAMNLLWHAGREEAAFLVFVSMMQNYSLQTMFEPPDMAGLKMRAFTVTQLVRLNMPDLSDHLAEYLQNNLELLIADWLLTLFASSVALAPLALLWDRFFEFGYSAIYRTILARLRCLRKWLLQVRDFTQLANLVRFAHVDFDYIDGQRVPRLRLPATCEQATTTVAGAAEKPSLLGRMAASLVHAPLSAVVAAPLSAMWRSGDAAGGSSPSPRNSSSGHPAAWTCYFCNGSDDCESWRCIVVDMTDLEPPQLDVITLLEQMYRNPRTELCEVSAGCVADVASPVADDERVSQNQVALPLYAEGVLDEVVAEMSKSGHVLGEMSSPLAESSPCVANDCQVLANGLFVDVRVNSSAKLDEDRGAAGAASAQAASAAAIVDAEAALSQTQQCSLQQESRTDCQLSREDLIAQNKQLVSENGSLRLENAALMQMVEALRQELRGCDISPVQDRSPAKESASSGFYVRKTPVVNSDKMSGCKRSNI